eukprot:366336-Chlamydomonas_euryale.AAC.32
MLSTPPPRLHCREVATGSRRTVGNLKARQQPSAGAACARARRDHQQVSRTTKSRRAMSSRSRSTTPNAHRRPRARPAGLVAAARGWHTRP